MKMTCAKACSTAKMAVYIGDMIKYPAAGTGPGYFKSAPRSGLGEAVFPGPVRRHGSAVRASRKPNSERSCTMCGSFCSMDNCNAYFAGDLAKSPKK